MKKSPITYSRPTTDVNHLLRLILLPWMIYRNPDLEILAECFEFQGSKTLRSGSLTSSFWV